MRILFLNSGNYPCGIRESGLMVYEALTLSPQYEIDYQEISEDNCIVPSGYNIYIFNYHLGSMGWLDVSSIEPLGGLKFTVVLEISPNDPFPERFLPPSKQQYFDGFIVLDPTMKHEQKNVFAFPRPLKNYKTPKNNYRSDIPVIGSFGILGYGKFHNIVDAVNKEFDEAVIRFSITHPAYSPESYTTFYDELLQDCYARAKKGIEIIVSNDVMTQDELVNWCAENTLNCFLYDREAAGLAAATDQAILSGRPLAITNNTTFRHILEYISPYPEWSLKKIIAESAPMLQKIQSAWTQEKFAKCFEEMLLCYKDALPAMSSDTIQLRSLLQKKDIPSLRKNLESVARKIYSTTLKKNVKIDSFAKKVYIKLTKKHIIPSYLISYAYLNEDIYFYRLFRFCWSGFYIEIGAEQPTKFSSTYLLYRREWRGINVVFNSDVVKDFFEIRPRDITIYAKIDETKETLSVGTDIGENNDQKSLAQICEQYIPQFCVGLDILIIKDQGNEKNIIKSGDWVKYRPKIILIKCVSTDQKINHHVDRGHCYWNEWEYEILSKGYIFVLFDGFNRYYIRQEDRLLRTYFEVPVSPELDGYIKVSDDREYNKEKALL